MANVKPFLNSLNCDVSSNLSKTTMFFGFQSMQLMGNSRGRSVYEAEISDDFRRPQTDAQLEQFIRAKYERKKYIDKKWTPAKVPEFPVGW
jgi:hypothetical protein